MSLDHHMIHHTLSLDPKMTHHTCVPTDPLSLTPSSHVGQAVAKDLAKGVLATPVSSCNIEMAKEGKRELFIKEKSAILYKNASAWASLPRVVLPDQYCLGGRGKGGRGR